MREVHIDREHVAETLGGEVYDPDGELVGTVTDVYLDDDSGSPEWIEVKTGLFKRRFVPLDHAQVVRQRVDIPYDRRVVAGTPKIKPIHGVVVPEDEDRLFHYYGISDYEHIPHPLRSMSH